MTASTQLALTRATIEELVERRQEPDWLRTIRLEAFDAFERLPMPDQRTEGWRRTSLSGLKLDGWSPLPSTETQSRYVEDPLAEQAGASLFAFRNGMSMREDSPEAGWVMDLQEALQEPLLAARIEKQFAKIVPPDYDKFTALHYAFFNSGVAIFIPRGVVLEEPIWVRHEFDDPAQLALVHTLILLDDESEARVVEDFTSTSAGLASGVVEQSLGANANFTGLIRINKPAHQTASSQEQKNILLSDRAKADSDPKLEILNNDVVRCTHGAAVGPVDPEMLFYLQSRGMDQETAEQLIVEGFFRSTLDKVGNQPIQDAVWSAIAS